MKKKLFAFLVLFSVLAFAVPSIAGGPWYVRSGAGGTADGLSWTNAKLTLAATLTGASAGDYVYISEDHAETTAASITLTSPGTGAAPVCIWCINHTSNTLATTGAVSTTGSSSSIVIGSGGVAYIYGITFNVSDGSNGGNFTTTGAANWIFDTCKINLTTSSTSVLSLAVSTACPKITFINTPIKFGHTSQHINVEQVDLKWLNTANAVDSAGSAPTSLILFTSASAYPAKVLLDGLDLSKVTGSLFTLTSNLALNECYVQNCKLGTGVALSTGAIGSDVGPVVRMDNCTSTSGVNYQMEHDKYQGTIKTEATIIRTGGATDGTTPLSWLLTSNTTPTFFKPLESPAIVFWSTATTKTPTVYITSNTALTTADIWLEVEYLGTVNYPKSVFALGRAAVADTPPVIPTGTGLSADGTSTWGGTAQTYKYTLTTSALTTAMAGPVKVKVMLAHASITVYVDPKVGWN
jgi:hypothetical protein